MNNYNKTSHSTYNNLWHFEWCTKYRYKMFKHDKYRTFCTIAVMEGAKRHNIEILEFNVQPDHLHIVASLPRGMTDIRALFLLKGYSSKLLFVLCCEFRLRLPNGHLWSKGNFSSTVGFTELNTVLEYVRNQDVHHAE